MSYKVMISAFAVGVAASIITSSNLQNYGIIGEVEAQSTEMEAIWYPQ